MDVIFTHCAGLDVHKKTVMACRITPDSTGQQAEGLVELKEFGTMTVDLLALSDWLLEAGITHVAMESTGEYWTPVYNLLEGTCTVCLVNAAHVKHVPGRKTDRADARWLAKLMRYGLLEASFIPSAGQRDWRDVTRYRTKLVQERSREVNRAQGVLERAHIKLASVATDMRGVLGCAILAALSPCDHGGVGERPLAQQDPAPGAGVDRAGAGASSAYAGHPVGAYRLSGRADRGPERGDHPVPDGPECEQRLAHGERCRWCGRPEADPPPPHMPLTFTQAITLLDTIPGVDQRGAERWVAETGIDMTRFGTPARLAVWAGVAPGNDASAGKQRSGRTRPGNQPLRTVLTQLAHAAARTKGTYLSALYHRLAARRGKKRAIVAVAHSMVVSAFHMLSRHEPYQDLGAHYFDQQRQHHLVDRLTRRIERLGYRVH